jgi:hypothetical protein
LQALFPFLPGFCLGPWEFALRNSRGIRDHLISLLEQGRLPLKTPLRRHGHLRDEPARLLPGDAEKQVERDILSENSAEAVRIDVLKVGHHGSKNSTTPEFLAAVRPRFGIISAGEDNLFGHPSPELLERLKYAGVQILRTDRDGAVHVLTDGERLEITCFVACPSAAIAPASVPEAPGHKQD